jgi:ORF6N domain
MAVRNTRVATVEDITRAILVLRGRRVLLDAELAALYGVTTRRLNEQVRRNRERFPKDFLFELTAEEFANLKSQFATSSWGGRRKLPHAFTEHGAIQAATILNSPRAVEMSVYVVRAFLKLREVLTTNRELARRFRQLESRLDSKAFVKLRELVSANRALAQAPNLGAISACA